MTETRILFDSRALTASDWNRDKRSLSADGWQVNSVQNSPGVVYIRKPYVDPVEEPGLVLDEAQFGVFKAILEDDGFEVTET